MLIGPVNKLSMSSSALLLAEVQALVGAVFFIGVCFNCLHTLCRNSLAVHPGLSVDLNLKVLAEAARESALLLLDFKIPQRLSMLQILQTHLKLEELMAVPVYGEI